MRKRLRLHAKSMPVNFRENVEAWETSCEGYWSAKVQPIQDQTGFPQDWVSKLIKLENVLHDVLRRASYEVVDIHGHKVQYWSMRGSAPSRIDGTPVGNGEYGVDGFRWTQGYSTHYLQKYNCLPTKRFYDNINALFCSFAGEMLEKPDVSPIEPTQQPAPVPTRPDTHGTVASPLANSGEWIYCHDKTSPRGGVFPPYMQFQVGKILKWDDGKTHIIHAFKPKFGPNPRTSSTPEQPHPKAGIDN